MDCNAFLTRFGIDPERFSVTAGPIKSDGGFVYEAEEWRDPDAKCPICERKDRVEVHSHYQSTVRCHQNGALTDFVKVRRIVYLCRGCGKTFTVDISGIMRKKEASSMLRSMLATEFSDDKTFTQIAREYHVSAAYAVGVFDSLHKKVERLGMPRVLCIDEFHFSSSSDQKYCCHLLDFETGMTVDIIKSRQKAYLREYFNAIPLGERRNVRWICTDMYDEYAAIKREFFPGAALVVDRFHVVEQLTGAVNVIRTRTMKTADKSSMEYSFMKSKWKVFLCLAARIPDRYVTFRKTGETAHYDEMVKRCIGLSEDLSQAWEALQSLLSHKCGEESFTDASKFVGFMSQKLLNCRSEDLKKVGATYRKWRAEIAMGICRNQEGLRLTNGRMEATNNVVKTVMKNAYGYRNFERFRKRSLLILWRKKRR